MIFEKIRLRALEPEDLELLYKWENNESNWIISNTVSPFSRFTLKRYLKNSHKTIYETGQLRLMIEVLAGNVTIGTVDLFDFDPFHKRAGIGILIAEESYRRQGYASMAIKCLTGYCFKTLQMHQLYCNILANNLESIDMFTKLGFVKVGVKKEWIKSGDSYIDEYMFQMIDDHPIY